jgi:hypothetical protein
VARAAPAGLGQIAAVRFLADLKLTSEGLDVGLNQRKSTGQIEKQELVGVGSRSYLLDGVS